MTAMTEPETPHDQDAEARMRQRYRAVRAGLAPDTPVAVLHIGAEASALAFGHGPEASTVLPLALGRQRTARRQFRRSPPTALELENAIAEVEDEVVRAHRQVVPGTALYTQDDGIRQIAQLAGVAPAPTMVLSVQALEYTFDRLAALALGRPASSDVLPASTEFAATLLILRECVHHLQFPSITVCP